MRVRELIEKLQEFDPDQSVYVAYDSDYWTPWDAEIEDVRQSPANNGLMIEFNPRTMHDAQDLDDEPLLEEM